MPAISGHLAEFAASANSSAPRHLGIRYNTEGVFQYEPGNTIVSHMIAGSPAQKAAMRVRDLLLSMPEAKALAFTPVSSLHMTIFQGIIEHRRSLPYWPEDMPLDAPIDTMTQHYMEKLGDYKGPGPVRVRTAEVLPTGFTMVGATEEDEKLLREWRDQLADIFGYRHPDHETYRFHITLAYLIEWIPDHRMQAWANVLADGLKIMEEEAPVFELMPPAFCSFNDMNYFEELKVLL